MYHVYLWLAFALLYALFFWKIGYEILSDSKGWFIVINVIIFIIPVMGSFIIEDLKGQINYINTHNCEYMNQSETSTVYTTVIVNNAPIITPIITTSYLWKCPEGLIWFDVSLKDK